MKHQNKIGFLLQQNGIVLSNRNKHKKIITLFVEDENVLYQRKRILKSHDCFLKQIHKKYSERYITTMFHMLFKNEKEYHVKRKDLSLTPLRKDNCYSKTTLTIEKNDNKGNKGLFKERYNLFPVVTPMYSNNNNKHTLSKQLKDIEGYRKKLFDIISSSEQVSERYLKFKKEQTIRRYEYLTKHSFHNSGNSCNYINVKYYNKQHKGNGVLFNMKTIQHTYIK